MKRPVVIDGRNLYDPARMANAGFDYLAVGRQGIAGNTLSLAAEKIDTKLVANA